MQIILSNLDGSVIAQAPVTVDEHGYLYVNPDDDAYAFEFDCALYGFQEGQTSTGNFTDDNGDVCAHWTVTGDDPRF